MAFKLFDRVKVNIATTGTGDVTFGSVTSSAFFTPAEAGAVAGNTTTYIIVDGNDVEEGVMTIGTNALTGVRNVTKSKISGAVGSSKINLSGTAILAFVAGASDFLLPDLSNASSAAAVRNAAGATTTGSALLTASDAEHARSAAGISGRNLISNAGFRINQRGYVSGAAFAAGAYAHDRWKAGASGGAYTFSQLVTSTQINISANKSIRQTTEAANVSGGTYVLSWEGTATGRIGVGGAPSGNFAVSPVVVTGVSAGQSLDVEFTGANAAGGSSIASNAGTLGKVQLEQGAIPTPFEFRSLASELDDCTRFYQFAKAATMDNGGAVATKGYASAVSFAQRMRAAPQVVDYTATVSQNVSSRSAADITEYGLVYLVAASGGPTLIDRVTITLSADL